MNLREAILEKHSKTQKDKIVKWVGSSQQRLDELLKLFLDDKDPVVVQRAGWPLSYCVENHPALIHKHLPRLLKHLQKPALHNAVRRNIVRILQYIDIPERFHGDVMNTCFEIIQSPDEEVAVKAFSLGVLEKMLPLYPDIMNELKLIIEERWEHETAAFHSRAKRILNFKW